MRKYPFLYKNSKKYNINHVHELTISGLKVILTQEILEYLRICIKSELINLLHKGTFYAYFCEEKTLWQILGTGYKKPGRKRALIMTLKLHVR